VISRCLCCARNVCEAGTRLLTVQRAAAIQATLSIKTRPGQTLGWLTCRAKVTETEAKLRTAVQDKNSFQMEKAALERELKVARSQAEKLTKNMDKVSPGC